MGVGACPPVRPELLGDVAAPGTMVGLPSIVALRSPLGEVLGLGEVSFAWPHPVSSDKVLFVVDDTAERDASEVASRGHEGVVTTLAKMGNTIAMVARLGVEARRQMTDEVVIQA